ncbi:MULTISPECIES: ATP-dependent DNA helicase [unclassified Campylobacter]|uniref:ATP-dependent DNA helicase n=1 Tax=unclassified Campylobacter TaxID=2593542 RepID=UPI0022E9DA84|nr:MULTISPECIES: AAA family ATPase [unclassified Campylobacter]MDA3042639.1 AAA family ATPase [Campylobacter sp. JMF_09 ED2]MDA3044547.1 AAA family ATPase [Campylobacter sp. JMF_07 ED4]MDA3063330.1 AAA family ATPase [Campylobacter sp. JMF_11 EL3]MDA3071524.1 AAA family ATPase [Campylobacter sp. VBCF_03 NA9]MDA3074412.1 AAA family ATPase [Campylobacter sp. JMF_05 ED3]
MINFVSQKLKSQNVFITGGGGVGKSYVVKGVIEEFRTHGKIVIVLGSTGISAVEIGGVTLHSFFKFGISKNFEELKKLDRSQKAKIIELNKILSITDLIVLDEISMVGADVFEMIEYRLVKSKFSGHLLVTGDFYQLPPVVKKDELSASKQGSLLRMSEYAFGTHAWETMKFFYIEMLGSKRTDDESLYEILSQIRLGKISENLAKFLVNLITPRESLDDNATIISGRNAEVNAINEARLGALDSRLYLCEGVCEIHENSYDDNKISKWLNSLNLSQSLRLKVGAKVLFTMNKSGEFYNGESGVVENIELNGFGEIDSIVVRKKSGAFVRVERAGYDYSEIRADEDEASDFLIARYYQFPLKLAYAITIHKSQGMSIENLACDIDRIFANGQLYVALSRATSLNGLKILYTRKEGLYAYLSRIVKIDKAVVKFYEENEFFKIYNQIL